MLFGPANFSDVKFENISISSAFVQGEMKNDSWFSGGKYSKKVLYENDTSDSTSAATKQKKLLKVFAVACGLVTGWYLRLIIFGESIVIFCKKIKALTSF